MKSIFRVLWFSSLIVLCFACKKYFSVPGHLVGTWIVNGYTVNGVPRQSLSGNDWGVQFTDEYYGFAGEKFFPQFKHRGFKFKWRYIENRKKVGLTATDTISDGTNYPLHQQDEHIFSILTKYNSRKKRDLELQEFYEDSIYHYRLAPQHVP